MSTQSVVALYILKIQEKTFNTTAATTIVYSRTRIDFSSPAGYTRMLLLCTGTNICGMPRIVSSQDWNSECSPRFGTFSFASSATVPACLDFTREGLPGGLLEGSCGRRNRRSMPDRLNVGMNACLLLPFQNTKMLSSVIRWRRKVTVWRSVETGAGGLEFCYTRNAKGL